jgi:hypothetical protein
MENEMMYMPLVWVIIAFTAILSAVVTTILPSLPNYWSVFKNAIRRVFTRKSKMDAVDVIIIAKLQDRIDDLENRINHNLEEIVEQVNNLSTNHYRRERNRKSNIRRDVREFLQEIKDGKYD